MLPLEMNWVCLVQGCRVLEKGFESYASGIFILKVRNSLLSLSNLSRTITLLHKFKGMEVELSRKVARATR